MAQINKYYAKKMGISTVEPETTSKWDAYTAQGKYDAYQAQKKLDAAIQATLNETNSTGETLVEKATGSAADIYNNAARKREREAQRARATASAGQIVNNSLGNSALRKTREQQTKNDVAAYAARTAEQKAAAEKAFRTFNQNRQNMLLQPVSTKELLDFAGNVKQNGSNQTNEENQKRTAGQIVFDMIERGAGWGNQVVASTADFLANAIPRAEGALLGEDPEGTFTGQLLKPLTDATGKLQDWVNRETAKADALVQAGVGDSKVGKVLTDIGSGAVAALPNAMLALMSGGTSAAATLAPQASGAAATAGAAVQKLAANPMFQLSVVQNLGSGYEEAKAAGATDAEAMVAATLSALTNSVVEIGGGVETLPGELAGADLSTAKKALQWVRSALDEGKEEVVQGVIEKLTNKAVFDQDAAWFSNEDESAVMNPVRMAQEFGMGTAVGGVLGGGQLAGNTLLNQSSKAKSGEQTTAASAEARNDSAETVQKPLTQEQLDAAIQATLRQNKNAPAAEAEAESTNVNTDPAQHTPQEQAVIEEYQNAVDPMVVSFINKWKGLQNQNYKKKIKFSVADVTERAAADVKKLTGVDASDYTHVLSGNALEHIENRHGIDGEADQSMADINDLGRIGYVLEHYDSAEPVLDKNGNPKHSRDNLNSDGTHAPLIRFQKKVNGTYYAVEAVPDTAAKQLRIISAYMEKGSTDQVLNMPQATSSLTSETYLGANTPISSIPTNPENVNTTDAMGHGAVGAAESGFDPYSQAANTYGTIEPGENPARVVDVPKSMDGESNVMQTVRTILEADVTTDDVIPELENEIVNGSFSAMPITDQAAAERAEQTIRRVGYEQALADWRAEVKNGKVGKDSVAIGETLYNAAVSAGDTKSAVKIAVELSTQVRSAAQALQAVRMLKKMSPAAQLYGVKQSVDNLQKKLTDEYGTRAPELAIDEQLAADFLEAETDDARAAAEKALYKNIAQQIPATFTDKWNAWRYLSMLGNAKTHIRNVAGNAAFSPVRSVKNQLGGLMEAVAEKAGWIDKSQRTKRVGFNLSKESRALVDAAKADYETVKGRILSGDKYNSATDIIEQNRRIFNNAALETLRKGNSKLLDLEDSLFSKSAYASSLAGYLKAQGKTAADFTGKGMTQQEKDAARAYAISEAQKATYRDLNALSEAVTSMRFKRPGDNVLKKSANVVMEGVLPFKKTPANILARALEYSPAGLAKALTTDIYQVTKGKITAAEYMDHLSSGLTGMGIFALGYFLSQAGYLVGGAPEDEDQFNLERRQSYSLEFGNTSITLDWLAPEAVPLFMGVELAETMEESYGQALSMNAIKSFFRGVSGPILEMSMMSGVQDALDAVSYADDKMTALVANAALGYLGQAVPTLFGQLERAFAKNEIVRQTTFTQDGRFLDTDTQYALGKTANKIPWYDFQQIPYIDAWGRTEENGSIVERTLNNMFNPAYTSTINETPVDAEIKRLEKQTGTNLTPSRADKKLTINGETILLTSGEYVTYATAKGQNDYTFRESLIASELYEGLKDSAKAKAMEYASDYANKLAQQETGLKPEIPQWMAELDGADLQTVTETLVRKAAESQAGTYKSQYDGISAMLEAGEINDQLALAMMSDSVVDGYANSAKKSGISVSRYVEAAGYYAKLEGEDSRTDMLDYISAQKDLSAAQKVGMAGSFYKAEDLPRDWLVENGAPERAIVATFTDNQKERWASVVKPVGGTIEDYVGLLQYKSSDAAKTERDSDGKEIEGKSTQEKVISYIRKLNLTPQQSRAYYLSVYESDKNMPDEWK